MKLSLNTDFTKFPRAVSVIPSAGVTGSIAGSVALAHDERHMRRRAIELADGSKVLVDLLEAVTLHDGDRLVLEDGRQIEITAAPEELYAIRGRDGVHLAELVWHLGGRHVAAAIEADRILVKCDHGLKAMLEELGATVTDVVEPFAPLHGTGHEHGHGHDHHHGHGEPDAYGRLPDDPHYGHNHP